MMPPVSAEPPPRVQLDAPPREAWSTSTGDVGWAFLFFVASGFCGLVYQVVWLRMIMARFGVNAPVASIVLSTFMLGLGVGSWMGGRLAHRTTGRVSPLALYGAAELVIASSALLVPGLIEWGHQLVNAAAPSWGSGGYFLASGAWIALALLPWCVCMGATFPLMMAGL
ncbi:MAG TPA: hypothetical protein VFY16_06335, partial [Gemmatimonadaceae bacterium]|nr:hypothetical protein [Gemmatimonadaceae bacterium]